MIVNLLYSTMNCLLQVYWVGPIIGGVMASIMYKFLFNPFRGGLSADEAIQQMRKCMIY